MCRLNGRAELSHGLLHQLSCLCVLSRSRLQMPMLLLQIQDLDRQNISMSVIASAASEPV